MKPIIFSTESIQAIQDERKTQTRRVIKGSPTEATFTGIKVGRWTFETENDIFSVKPRHQPGDILWVRETWAKVHGVYIYKADEDDILHSLMEPNGEAWRSPIYMPRAAARLWLRVTDIRIERVQDICEKDARAEGVRSYWLTKGAGEGADDWHESSSPPFVGAGTKSYRTRCDAYQSIWNKHNAKRKGGIYAWEKNPWVEVTEFERIEKPEVELV